VIDNEIYNGILKHPKGKISNRVLVYLREIQNIEKYANDDSTIAAKYIDMNIECEIDHESVALFNDLKNKLIDHLPAENIHRMKVK
jgi:hypothetical protein